jgi:hypothetical protein
MDTFEQPGDQPKRWHAAGPAQLSTTARAQELYEQLLALADKVGAAYAEAFEQIGGAYTEAYQAIAPGTSTIQDSIAAYQQTDWQGALSLPGATQDKVAEAQERALEIGDQLTDMGLEMGLAYLDAVERASVAAAKCHEQLGALSRLELLTSTAGARAKLIRSVTEACTTTLRNIVG